MPITALRLIRKMRGGAQSHLIECDDGAFYIVKFLNNPQHRRILVNELVSAVILKYLQIATPEMALVRLTDEFLGAHPEVAIQLGSRFIPVIPGWHYGSRHPGHPERLITYDFVPDALLKQINNLTDFLGVLVFDKWIANSDGRQSIFFRAQLKNWFPETGAHPRKMGFVALMIDNGFAFNGPHWDYPEGPVFGLYARKLVYQDVRSFEDFEPWLGRVLHFPDDVLDQAMRQVPPEWIEGDEAQFEKLLVKLLARRKRVPDLIGDSRRAKANPFPNWSA